MESLSATLSRELAGRVAWVGLGNPGLGDDSAGVRLAEGLAADGVADVYVAALEPERVLAGLRRAGFDHLVFLDAVELEAEPGTVAWLSQAELSARFPQVSTHRLALSMLARLVTEGSATRAWLLGIQAASLAEGPLTPAVARAVDTLRALLPALSAASQPAALEESSCSTR